MPEGRSRRQLRWPARLPAVELRAWRSSGTPSARFGTVIGAVGTVALSEHAKTLRFAMGDLADQR
jgi:hypothetical protein